MQSQGVVRSRGGCFRGGRRHHLNSALKRSPDNSTKVLSPLIDRLGRVTIQVKTAEKTGILERDMPVVERTNSLPRNVSNLGNILFGQGYKGRLYLKHIIKEIRIYEAASSF